MTRSSSSAENFTLVLMRHGKSDWNAGAADDASRPLSRRGEKASTCMGSWLKKHGLKPDFILASPAVRARETARIVASKTGFPAAKIRLDERLYEAGVTRHMDSLRSCGAQAGTLLLVGHNPGLEEFLAALCTTPPDIPDDGKLLPTAAVAILEIPLTPDSLQPGQAVLRQLVRPRQLGC
jgi:phosphohistidine phosphatase